MNTNVPASIRGILDTLGFNEGKLTIDSRTVCVYYDASAFGNKNGGMVAEISYGGRKVKRQLNSDKQTRETQLINIVDAAKCSVDSEYIRGYFGIRDLVPQDSQSYSIKTGIVEIVFQTDIDNMCKFRVATHMILGGKDIFVVNCVNTASAAHAAKTMLATLLPDVEETSFIQQMIADADRNIANAIEYAAHKEKSNEE